MTIGEGMPDLLEDPDEYLCDACADEQLFTCNDCGEQLPRGSMSYDGPTWIETKFLCLDHTACERRGIERFGLAHYNLRRRGP